MASLPETVLSNPIISYSVKSFVKSYNSGIRANGSIQSWVDKLRLVRGVPETLEYHRSYLNPYLWKMTNSDFDDTNGLKIAISCLELMVKHLKAGLQQSLSSLLFNRIKSSWPETNIASDVVTMWYRRQAFWNHIVKQQFAHAQSGTREWKLESFGWICKRFVLLWRGPSVHPVLLDYDTVLMIKDICSSYFISHVYQELTPGLSISSNDLVWFEAWTSRVLLRYGNRGYNMIKSIESMCKARIIQLTEELLDPDEVWNEMKQKLLEKEAKCLKEYTLNETGTVSWDIVAEPSTTLSDELAEYLQSLKLPEELSEMFCLLKMGGHPHVKVRLGGLKSQRLGKKRSKIPIGAGLELERSFCHIYLRGFVKRHKEWPPLHFMRGIEEPRSMLEILRDRNFQNLPLGLSMYPSTDWDQCMFIPHKIFNKGEDVLALLSDRALSFRRNEFDYAWRYDLDYRPRKPTTSRRVLVDILRRKEFNLDQICDWVSTRTLPEHHKIVTLCPKEREMKLEPRMFSMMTLEMRTFFALLEKNIAENIFCEIPEQTMTESRLDTVNRFYGLSGVARGEIKVHDELDLESWNLLWEDKVVNPIGNRIDQIHGTSSLFTFIHQFFNEAMINVRVDGFIPDGLTVLTRESPPESPLLWYGHHSGFEGIAQKLWTAATAAMIHSVLWPMGLDYSISGQGDNQMLTFVIRFPKQLQGEERIPYLRSLVRKIKQKLATGCKRYGQIAKPEECTQSTSFFSYSKEMWVNGRSLPTTLKGVSRLFPTTTSESPSLQEMVGGLTSGALASTERSLRPAEGYWPSYVAVCLLLHDELSVSLIHGTRLSASNNYPSLRFNDKVARVFALSSIPQSLGGLPIPMWSEFSYRGVPDPLSSGVAWMKLLASSTIHLRWMTMLLTGALSVQDPDAKRLVLDPFSLPLSRPQDPTTAVGNAVKDKLVDVSINHQIFEMLSLRRQSEPQLLADIISLRPIYPKIAHDLYSLSIPGVVSKFSRRFTNTRTIMSIGRLEGVPLTRISINSDLAITLWIIQNMEALGSYPPQEPNLLHSYQTSAQLRLQWKVGHLEGVSLVHPIDIGLYDCSCRAGLEKEANLVVSVIHNLADDPLMSRGPIPPYLGSSTQIKAAYKGAKLVESSPPLRDCLKLLQTRKAIALEGTESWKLISRIAQSRVQFDIAILDPYIPPIIGGTLAHRFNLTDAESGSYLPCHPNIASHVALSSNLSQSVGEDDRPVVYQTVYLFLLFLHTLCWVRKWGAPFVPSAGPRSIYARIDVNRLPIVLNQRPLLINPLKYQLVSIVDNYYLTGRQAYIHSRTRLAAFMAKPDGVKVLPLATGDLLMDALRYLTRQKLKSTATPLLSGGVSWALGSGGRMVDMPEAKRISREQYEQAFCQASLDFQRLPRLRLGRKWETKTEWEERLVTEVINTFLPVSTALLSTYNEGYENREGIHHGIYHGIEGGIRLTSRVLSHLSRCLCDPAVVIFIEEPESVLSGGLILLNRLVTTASHTESQANFQSAQTISKIARVIRLRSADDMDWQARLWDTLPDILKLHPIARRSVDHPASILRDLRLQSRIQTASIRDKPLIAPFIEVSRPCGQCRLGGKELDLPGRIRELAEGELHGGWLTRQGLVANSEILWSPLPELLNTIGSVHVIGAGAGHIDSLIPSTVRCTYYDLAEYSVRRGQKLVDPPIVLTSLTSATRWMSSLSWSCENGVDIEDEDSLAMVASLIQYHDTVIIDVDGVNIMNRIKAANYLIRHCPGSLVLVKLYGEEQDINDMVLNSCASGGKSRIWWRSPVLPSRELVVGSIGLGLTTLQCLGTKSCTNDVVYFPTDGYLPENRKTEEQSYLKLSNILTRKRCKLARRDPDREERRRLLLEATITN